MMCDYGCGREATHRFKNGKWCCSKNIASCPTTKEKISLISKGKPKPERWKKNISKGKKGKPAWNKGNNSYLTPEIRSKMGRKNKGKEPWNKGKKGIFSDETLKTISETAKSRTGKNSSNWKGGYSKRNIPRYSKYITEISYAEECRRNPNDEKILDVRCTYCGKWFTPSIQHVYDRIRALNGNQAGEQRLYCSEKCKMECPIYKQHKYPKNYKPSSSREVQPELRQMRFEIDNYTCQKCNKHQLKLDVGLHCHHIEGINWEPIESADIDKVITLCKNCHIEVHKKEGCGYNEMRCKNEGPTKDRKNISSSS
jgi:hypothetical protein